MDIYSRSMLIDSGDPELISYAENSCEGCPFNEGLTSHGFIQGPCGQQHCEFVLEIEHDREFND